MLSDNQSGDDLDTNEIFKDFNESKVFRYSKLHHLPGKLDKHLYSKNLDSSNESDGRKPMPVYDLGKQLLICSKIGDYNKVHSLIRRGAPYATDWLGMSALHFAAMRNHLKICELLLVGGISRDGRTKVDKTPLHFAAYEGHESVVRLLVEYKCDVNARDMLKMTPLHWAIEKRHKSIAELLLKHGADVTYVSKFGKSPICIAIETGQLDLIDELNAAKEVQTLQKSVIESAKNQKETNQAVKSITVKLDKDESIECEITNDIEYTTIEEDKSYQYVSKLPSKTPRILNHEQNIGDHDDEDKYIEPIVQTENLSDEDSREAEATVLELLKSHGISMLPKDDNATSFLSSALKSGRKIVLSEGGKLVLNEIKPKQLETERETEKIENKLKPVKVENNSGKPESEKQEREKFEVKKEKKSPIIVQAKGLGSNSRKTVKVISVESLKQIYGEDLVNSLKKFREQKSGKHLITHITKLPKRIINEQNSEIKKDILSTETKTKNIEKSHENTIDESDLPPNIEICLDNSDRDNDNDKTVRSPILSDNKNVIKMKFNIENVCSLNNLKNNSSEKSDKDDDHEKTKLQPVKKFYTNNKQSFVTKKLTNNLNTDLKEIILKRRAESPSQSSLEVPPSKKIILKKLNPTLIKKDATNAIPLLNITEICRQLHELKKITEELKKTNEEYRIRIEKLEKDHSK